MQYLYTESSINTLNNDKSYKYYELIRVPNSETPNIIQTRARSKAPTFEQLKTRNTIKRKLNKEGIDTTNIVTDKRERKPTDRLHY